MPLQTATASYQILLPVHMYKYSMHNMLNMSTEELYIFDIQADYFSLCVIIII